MKVKKWYSSCYNHQKAGPFDSDIEAALSILSESSRLPHTNSFIWPELVEIDDGNDIEELLSDSDKYPCDIPPAIRSYSVR